jgi:hypothetical protein
MVSRSSSALLLGDATFHSSGSYNKWRSTHPFPGSQAGDVGIDNEKMYWVLGGIASPTPIPKVRNHFAYSDGHVAAARTAEMEVVTVTTSANGINVLPRER